MATSCSTSNRRRAQAGAVLSSRSAPLLAVLALLSGLVLGTAPGRAEALAERIAAAVAQHDRVIGAEAALEAAQQRARVALGGWYPALDLRARAGREYNDRDRGRDTTENIAEIDLTLTQLLWDFGRTDAQVETARLAVARAETELQQERQDLTFEAVEAVIGLVRSRRVFAFARQSEDNIRAQTGVEAVRIDEGAGLSTDLLQSKAQLARARARRVAAEQALDAALNRWRAVFGDVPADLYAVPLPAVPGAALPPTLAEAVHAALLDNPALRLGRIAQERARTERWEDTARALLPRVEAVIERSDDTSSDDLIDEQRETVFKVELRLPINLGGTAINTLRAADADAAVADRRVLDRRREIEEAVANAWTALEAARQRQGFLEEQVGLSRAFLETAREERTLGTRSLLDVLAGETDLIEAESDAAAAEADLRRAAFELLRLAGRLDPDLVVAAADAGAGTEDGGTEDGGTEDGGAEAADERAAGRDGVGAAGPR